MFVDFSVLQVRTERLAEKFEALVQKDAESVGGLSPYSIDGEAMKD
jgi:hypothetical protein